MRGNNQLLKDWKDLPEFMRADEIRPYWEVLNKRRGQLALKRVFDIVMSLVLFIILLIPMLVIAIAIKLGSPGPVLYRQIRITQYGRKFKINKFRTMYDRTEEQLSREKKNPAEEDSSLVTILNDRRVTKVGKVLRKYRLDEFPQVINVLTGDMSFVGTRPEVLKYVEKYRVEWNATLLMPAGITSECSIQYKDEDKLLNGADDVDCVYVNVVLPKKMVWNLKSIRQFGFKRDVLTMFQTVFAVLRKDYYD